MEDEAVKNSRITAEHLLDHMGKRDYCFLLVVGSKPSPIESERIRIGVTADILENKHLMGPMIRLLRDVADILQRGDEHQIREWVDVPRESS